MAENRSGGAARPAAAGTDTHSWLEAPPATGRLKLLPTELYLATMVTPGGNRLRALGALAGLLGLALVVQAASWAVFLRLLAGPSGSHARVAHGGAAWGRLPGLSDGASAVARAQLRLHTRTPRGRIGLIMPLLITGVFATPTLLGRRGSPFHLSSVPPGAVLGVLAAAFSLLSIGPIALNQFSSAGGGLVLEMLSPLADRDLIVGKAAGLTAAAMGRRSRASCVLAVLFPGTPPGLALAPPLAAAAACLAAAPVWALLSAIFPRKADLNSISRSGNPHGLATLLGTFVKSRRSRRRRPRPGRRLGPRAPQPCRAARAGLVGDCVGDRPRAPAARRRHLARATGEPGDGGDGEVNGNVENANEDREANQE